MGRSRPAANEGFFAVGHDTFLAACALGLNEAAALLVQARGSLADNATTAWSARAVATRLAMRQCRAKAAITRLVDDGLLRIERAGTRPRYVLAQQGALIWLPNALIDGVGAETPPILKLRQTQDGLLLRLFVELYGKQNLREYDGIDPTLLRQVWERKRIGQHGPYLVWRFHTPHLRALPSDDLVLPHHLGLSDAERQKGAHPGAAFFARLSRLKALGLIEWVPWLFDGPDGEPLHPLYPEGDAMEDVLFEEATNAGARCSPGDQEFSDYCYTLEPVVPVAAHIDQVCLIGIARLRYRPKTKLTAAWRADYVATCRRWTATYAEIAQPVDAARTRAA